MRLSLLAGIVGSSLVGFGIHKQAQAEVHEIWQGWMNIQPCTKIEWRPGDFGIPSPTYKSGPQEMHGRLTIDIPNEQAILEKTKNCGVQAAAACGAAAIITSWGGCAPAFTAQFKSCLAEEASKISMDSLFLNTWTECKW